MKNLLQIVKAVINETGLGEPPTAVAASTDPLMVQCFALANRVGYDLANIDGPNNGWASLRKEYTFSTVNGQDAYSFPSDFGYIISSTEWDRDQRWPLGGPLSADEWQQVKSGMIGAIGPRTFFRIMRDSSTTVNKIYLFPTPSYVHTIAFEYYSDQWCASGGSVVSAFTGDNDTPLIYDALFILGIKWRLLRIKGLDYSEEYKEYADTLGKLMARDSSSRSLPLGSYYSNNLISYRNIPDSGFGS